MKLLTLNTHSLIEPDYEQKLKIFAEVIKKEQPEVFALQEVNQTLAMEEADLESGIGYIPCSGYEGPIRKDNHAFRLASLLKEIDCPYQWTWISAKLGYDIYEEGLSLFSRCPIERTEQFFISKSHDFSNWKTRKMLAIQSEGIWFCSVHMGWWEDEEEPFKQHWNLATKEIQRITGPDSLVWVMGDFNSPAGLTGEGFDYVKSCGWQDSYELAEEKDSGITVEKVIDGWEDRLSEVQKPAGMRIDYIWCNKQVKISSSKVICNGIFYPIVSDHYGIIVT